MADTRRYVVFAGLVVTVRLSAAIISASHGVRAMRVNVGDAAVRVNETAIHIGRRRIVFVLRACAKQTCWFGKLKPEEMGPQSI
jgi:hypothetical protein